LSWGDERHPLAGIVRELKRRHGDIWLDLGDMAPSEGRQFVDAYLDTQPNRLGETFREALFQHTGGHALFTVELLREMQERGDVRPDEDGHWLAGAAIDWQTLPAKVEGVIEKRIERLEEALREVLTIASVEGEFFTAEIVARVQQVNERGLVKLLSHELDKRHRLVTAQALEWLGQQRLSLYRFRHHLFQHYLYYDLDEIERAYLHQEVGNVLEALYGDQTGQVAVQLARHFERAGLKEKAVKYLRQAGDRARQLSANEEAVVHFSRGLVLLKTLPDTPERTQKELDLQVALGPALMATKGYAAPEVEQAYARARELCQHAYVGETPQLFPVLAGLRTCYLVQGKLQAARELGEQCLAIAQRVQNPAFLLRACEGMGITLFHMGEFVSARVHLEQGIALYDSKKWRAGRTLQDPGVDCLSYAAMTLWVLGYPDQARKRSQEALVLAQELSHPFSLAFALFYAAMIHQFFREVQAVQERTEAAITFSTGSAFAYLLALATIVRGWALAMQGAIEEGIQEMRQGLAASRITGTETERPYFPALLAEVYGIAEQAEEGLKVLAKTLVVMDKGAERSWEAELYRLKGELLLTRSAGTDEGEVEQHFYKAIDVARQQSAKSLELRAVMSLSRLWHSQGSAGKKDEARQMLAEIYGWFTEGFDTADLKEAKTLLEELS
jgi:predicted ATPase